MMRTWYNGYRFAADHAAPVRFCGAAIFQGISQPGLPLDQRVDGQYRVFNLALGGSVWRIAEPEIREPESEMLCGRVSGV